MKEANKISKHIIDISGIDVFKNTRKREHIEMRSLLTFMLRHHCNMTFHQIKNFYESKGKSYDHATALHSLKSFETHRRYNPKLDKYFDVVLLRIRNKSKLRRALINHIIDYTKEKDLKKLLRIVDTLPLKDIDGKEQTKEKADTTL
tara:strand:+ start:96 stop:536 length:441 start_codon:yes stop_codon:yes gene_type:complete